MQKKNFNAIHVDYVSTAFDGRGGDAGEKSGKEGGRGGGEEAKVMVVDRFFLDANGAISKKIFVVFADNKYRRT